MMTATSVGEVAVIATGPAYRKIPNGETRQMVKIVELLLEDGRIMYGCTLCDFVRDTMHFGAHFAAHGTGKRARQAAAATAAKKARRRPVKTEQEPETMAIFIQLRDAVARIDELERRVSELESTRPVQAAGGRVTDVLRSLTLEILAANPDVAFTPSTMELALTGRDGCPEIPNATSVANVLRTLATRGAVVVVEHNRLKIYKHKA